MKIIQPIVINPFIDDEMKKFKPRFGDMEDLMIIEKYRNLLNIYDESNKIINKMKEANDAYKLTESRLREIKEKEKLLLWLIKKRK